MTFEFTASMMLIDAGMAPGIAVNPGTSVETVAEMLRIVEKVLGTTLLFGKGRPYGETVRDIRGMVF